MAGLREYMLVMIWFGNPCKQNYHCKHKLIITVAMLFSMNAYPKYIADGK